MNHDKMRESLSDFHDEVLGDGERRKVEEHLRSCAPCAAELSRYARAESAIRGAARRPSREETEVFARAVLARLEPDAEEGLWAGLFASPRRTVPAFVLALAAFAAVLRPPDARTFGPAEALLAAQDGGDVYEWLSGSPEAASSRVLPLGER